ncbi:MAG: PEGA domain-containing protein [Myxococcota bacterium]
MPTAFRLARGLTILATLALAVAPAAHAQPPTEDAPTPPPGEGAEVDEAAKKKASQFYEEAERLFDQELYSAAVENYRKAYDLYPAPAILYNIAKSWERLGDADRCVEGYEAYLEAYQEEHGGDPPDIVDVRNSIAKCRLGAKVRLRVDSEPSGAAIYIDDKTRQVGQTPYTTHLDPGDYTIWLDKQGYQPFEREITVRSGEPVELVLPLEKIRHVGKIVVDANIRKATIFIDGQPKGLTPYDEPIEVAAGTHQVRVSKDEYISADEEVTVPADETRTMEANLWLRDPPSSWKKPLGWTSISLGVVMGAGGFVAGLEADKHFAGTDDFDKWERFQTIGYGVGGGLVGVGVILLIWEAVDVRQVKESDELTEAEPRWSPTVAVDGRGAFAGARVDF